MKFLVKCSQIFQKYMAAIVVVVTVFAYIAENSFTSWVANPAFLGGQVTVNHLLMIVMFGMGLTMRISDFAIVFSRPRDIILGELAQFIIMPFTAFALCTIFHLPPELAVGVILVGCCPGGTSSNVMTYMAKGDVALSIGMTSVSTVLAPILTPLITGFYVSLYSSTTASGDINVDIMSMFIGIVQIVIVPIVLGLVINRFFEKFAQTFVQILPMISCIAICIIVGFVIDANSAKIFANGVLIIFVVLLHNCCGYALGFLIGKLIKLSPAKRNAIAIEVGMQNSGLATSLAASCFPDLALATVPGALFSAWHNITGAIVASIMGNAMKKEDK